jgi:hypothetical protein
MKGLIKIIIFGTLIFIGLYFLGEYITQYSEESFKSRTVVYALQGEEGWSEEECRLLIEQKEDSLLDAYFPIISVVLK